MKIRIGMQCSKTSAIMIGAPVVLIGMRLLQWLSSGAMSVSLKLMVVMTQMVIPLLILFVLLSMSLVRIFDMAKTDRLVIRITPELKSQLQAAAEADGRSVSNYIEKLIKEAIKKED